MRSTLGYTGEQPRMQMLQNKEFVDARVEIFLKQGSKVLGQARRVSHRSAIAHEIGTLGTSAPSSHIIPAMATSVSTSLERRLGPFDAAAIIVSNVIGGGILFTPPHHRRG